MAANVELLSTCAASSDISIRRLEGETYLDPLEESEGLLPFLDHQAQSSGQAAAASGITRPQQQQQQQHQLFGAAAGLGVMHSALSSLTFNPVHMCSVEAPFFAPTLDQSSYLFWSMSNELLATSPASSYSTPTSSSGGGALQQDYDSEDISSSSSSTADYVADSSAAVSPVGIHPFFGPPGGPELSQLFQSSLLCDLMPLNATHDTRQQERFGIIPAREAFPAEIRREAANSAHLPESPTAEEFSSSLIKAAAKPAASNAKRKCTIGRLLYESARLRHGIASSQRGERARPRRSKKAAAPKAANGPQTYEHKSTKVAKRSTVRHKNDEQVRQLADEQQMPATSPLEIAVAPPAGQYDDYNNLVMWNFVAVDPLQPQPAEIL